MVVVVVGVPDPSRQRDVVGGRIVKVAVGWGVVGMVVLVVLVVLELGGLLGSLLGEVAPADEAFGAEASLLLDLFRKALVFQSSDVGLSVLGLDLVAGVDKVASGPVGAPPLRVEQRTHLGLVLIGDAPGRLPQLLHTVGKRTRIPIGTRLVLVHPLDTQRRLVQLVR